MPAPWGIFGGPGPPGPPGPPGTAGGSGSSGTAEGVGAFADESIFDFAPSLPPGLSNIVNPEGILVVANITARNNIPVPQTQVGMLVNVLDNGSGITVMYMLTALPASTSTNWVPFGVDPNIAWLGAGRDGSLAPGFGTLILTEDSYYQDISPKTDGTDVIITNGFLLRWAGTLDLRGCPEGTIRSHNTGINGGTGGAATTAGTSPASTIVAGNTVGGGQAGSIGGTGTTTNGNQAGAAAGLGNAAGSANGASGAGGTSGSGTGGGSRAATAVTLGGTARVGVANVGNVTIGTQNGSAAFAYNPIEGGIGGAGGGGGAGNGATAGAGGGGGGVGGGILDVAGNLLLRDGTTAARCIWCYAGKGGAGGTTATNGCAGGGGASGAGGGLARLSTMQIGGSACTGLLSADGGDGGDGGNGLTTGNGGDQGSGGKGGLAVWYDFSSGTITRVAAGTGGTAGATHSGTTGGTGAGQGGQSRVTV